MSFVAQNAVWALPMRPASCKFVLLALAMSWQQGRAMLSICLEARR